MDAQQGDRQFWETHACHYDRAVTGLFGGPLPRTIALTTDAVAGADRVLEVAAGTGLFTAAIAPRVRSLVATDYADGMLASLRERLASSGARAVETARRDIYALGYPPGSFDVVVAANVLHLVPDLPRALDALQHVLRPGGRLIAPTYCHRETVVAFLVSRLLLAPLGQPMQRRFTAASLNQALESQGLRVVRTETIPGLIPVAYVEAVTPAARVASGSPVTT